MVNKAACFLDSQCNPAITKPAFVLVVYCFDLVFYVFMLCEHRLGLQVVVEATAGDFKDLQQ